MSFRSPILAGTTLVRSAIQSNNYSAGHAGWQIATSGSAEFNNIVIRGGSVVGSDQLWYNGTPAHGNLAFSISENGGTDAYGNQYPGGVVAYNLTLPGDDVQLANGSTYYGPANATGVVASVSTPDQGLTLVETSGQSGSGSTGLAATVTVSPGTLGGASGSTAPSVTIGSGAQNTPGDLYLHLGNLFVKDSVGLVQGWTAATLVGVVGDGGAGMKAGFYTRKLGVGGMVAVTGNVHTTGTVNNGTVIATGLPPTASGRAMIPCSNNVSGGGGSWGAPMVFVDSSGQATYYGANLASGSQIYLTGIYPTIGV